MKNKIALVTGASSGIGKDTAEQLVLAGYKVYGTSRQGGSSGNAFIQDVPLNVTSNESGEAAVAELIKSEGRIDLLVNNTGFGAAPTGAEESTIEQAKSIFDTNFYGMLQMITVVVPFMRRQSRGRIINISSLRVSYQLPIWLFMPQPRMRLKAIQSRWTMSSVHKAFAFLPSNQPIQELDLILTYWS